MIVGQLALVAATVVTLIAVHSFVGQLAGQTQSVARVGTALLVLVVGLSVSTGIGDFQAQR